MQYSGGVALALDKTTNMRDIGVIFAPVWRVAAFDEIIVEVGHATASLD
jgi:hypothetical protein